MRRMRRAVGALLNETNDLEPPTYMRVMMWRQNVISISVTPWHLQYHWYKQNQYVAINMWQSICGNQYVANLMFCEVMKTRYALITRSMCVPLISVQWSICGINIWQVINMWSISDQYVALICGKGGGRREGTSTRETSLSAISVQLINMWH